MLYQELNIFCNGEGCQILNRFKEDHSVAQKNDTNCMFHYAVDYRLNRSACHYRITALSFALVRVYFYDSTYERRHSASIHALGL